MTEVSKHYIADEKLGVGAPDILTLISRLTAQANRQQKEIDTLHANLQTFAEQTESNSEDIRTLDERTQVVGSINKFYAEGSERQ